MPRFKNYNLIMFDFDGTLADSADGIIWCMKKAFKELNLNVPTSEEIRETIGIPLDEIFKILVKVEDKELINSFIERYSKIYMKEAYPKTFLFNGVDEVLKTYFDLGIKLVIVTNKRTKQATYLLELLKIDTFIDCVFGKDYSMYFKPDSRLFDLVISSKYKDITKDKVLMVGDTETDINFSKNSKIDSCFTTYGYGNTNICKALNPTYIINKVNELL